MGVTNDGNSGSGKTTLARSVSRRLGIAHPDLDRLAWDPGPRRREFEESVREILRFLRANRSWVIEGCYGDLIELAVPACDKMRFLNPGVEVCVDNCRARPWEPRLRVSDQEPARAPCGL